MVVIVPKGPCTHIVYTLALKCSLYRYFGPKVYAIWAHGPLGSSYNYTPFLHSLLTKGKLQGL